MDDEESAKLILALNEPEEIKRIGRHIKNFNQELWEIYCLDVVEKRKYGKGILIEFVLDGLLCIISLLRI